MQEAAGLQSVTDGEFRRAFWHVDFLTGFEGIVATQGQYALKFHGEGGAESETKSMMVVNGKVKRTRPVMVEHFRFLKNTTKKTAKLCIPAPTYLHMRGGRRVVNEKAYPDVEEFWSDITRAYREEIAELAAAGLQLPADRRRVVRLPVRRGHPRAGEARRRGPGEAAGASTPRVISS